jgi:hypothetical protein
MIDQDVDTENKHRNIWPASPVPTSVLISVRAFPRSMDGEAS